MIYGTPHRQPKPIFDPETKRWYSSPAALTKGPAKTPRRESVRLYRSVKRAEDQALLEQLRAAK